MKFIRAHFRYISRNGELEIEDDRGITREGKEALHDLAEQWQHAGSFIDERSHRREAFNMTLSMPHGTDPLYVQRAAREFAQTELKGHRYVMALHDDQANPHVHISVRAESRDGERLNPRKPDLQRWRETFAGKLRGWGIDAQATRQATRGQIRNYQPIWRVKADEEQRLDKEMVMERSGKGFEKSQAFAKEAWDAIIDGLKKSENFEDRTLAEQADRFVRSTPYAIDRAPEQSQLKKQERIRAVPEIRRAVEASREDRGIER
jgi:Relaxase/Mobilisation nuclease domain